MTGALHFFESRAGMISDIAPVILLPKPPPVYSLVKNHLAGIDVEPAGDGRHGLNGALRAGKDMHFAVLPVSHRTACFQAVMTGVGRHEGFIQNQRGFLESGIDIAVRPGVGGVWNGVQLAIFIPDLHVGDLAYGQFAILSVGKLGFGPFPYRGLDGRRRWWRFARLRGRCRRAYPDVTADSGIRSAGPECVQRIDDEWQMLELDFDLLDRFGSGQLVDCGNS
jgi:hypothetical protein